MEKKEYTADEAYVYMVEHHPHVHTYASAGGLRQAMYRKGFWPKGEDTTSQRRLDNFANAWQPKGSNGDGKERVGIVISEKSLPPAPRQRRWRNIDEMIAHYAGTGEALHVPPGISSLKEIK